MVQQGVCGTEVPQLGPGAEPRWGAIGTMKYYAYKTGFCASSVCILLLKHALKLKRQATMDTLGMMYPARGV